LNNAELSFAVDADEQAINVNYCVNGEGPRKRAFIGDKNLLLHTPDTASRDAPITHCRAPAPNIAPRPRRGNLGSTRSPANPCLSSLRAHRKSAVGICRQIIDTAFT